MKLFQSSVSIAAPWRWAAAPLQLSATGAAGRS
ncbi:hypothetical protein Z046_25480 [Pseudomonas aeruginosa VRFPA09]|nr:hypothetical protein Z046_25480 [Pseudomonas aeruginosa VRFPA09]